MSEQVISISAAARQLSDCVDRAHSQNQSFVLTKHGVPLARIIPADKPACCGRDLAKAMVDGALSPAELRIWQRDLRTARKKLPPPTDPWQ